MVKIRKLVLGIICVILFLGIFLLAKYYNSFKLIEAEHISSTLRNNIHSISEQNVVETIKSIVSKYGLEEMVDVKLYKNGVIGAYTFETAEMDNKVIVIETIAGRFTDKSKYIEVQAAMDVWLYLINLKEPYYISGMYFMYTESGKRAVPCEIILSRKEFIELCEEAHIEALSLKEQIQRLSRWYGKKYAYERFGTYHKAQWE